jgi:8-oxo-dGTP pyrophosphatase MutT (NUDIX family)
VHNLRTMSDLPPVLAAGGIHHWSGVSIDWTFEVGDGWDLDNVGNVLLVPFAGDRVVVLQVPGGYSPVGGTLEPGEHWCVTATRELMEEAGARLLPTAGDRSLLHPIGSMRCRSHAAEPFRPHVPHPISLRVVAWCDIEIVGPPTMPEGGEQVDEVLVLALDEAAKLLHPPWAALYQLAAELRARGVDDATLTRDTVRLLEEHYLRAPTPVAQSGKHGNAADWELARRLVVRPVHHDGTFLDLGCANGLLMESVRRWAAEDGRLLDPYGLDASERLVELARRRLPHWRDHFFVGDALTWTPPRRFDFVHTMVDLVPARRRADWLGRVLREFVAPAGRLIVRDYAGIGERLRDWGLPVAGVTLQERGDRPAQEAAWMEAPPR